MFDCHFHYSAIMWSRPKCFQSPCALEKATPFPMVFESTTVWWNFCSSSSSLHLNSCCVQNSSIRLWQLAFTWYLSVQTSVWLSIRTKNWNSSIAYKGCQSGSFISDFISNTMKDQNQRSFEFSHSSHPCSLWYYITILK